MASVESQRWRASRRGSESGRGTAGNKTLLTARRSRRASESWKGKEEREQGSSGGLGEPHGSQWAGKPRPGAVGAGKGSGEDSLWNGVRADQGLKGAGTYWKVKGLEKNMKESTIVMAFLPVVTAERARTKNTNRTNEKTKSQQA